MPQTLGIDASTQSVSAVVIDTDAGKVIAEASVNFGADLPAYNAPQGFIPGGAGGEVHSDPSMWLDALDLCLKRLAQQTSLAEIAAVCGAGQQHGTVYLNEQWLAVVSTLKADKSLSEQIKPAYSRASAPIWMDSSTSAECQEIAEALGGDAEVCARSGSIAIERFSGPQIRRFYKNDASAYTATKRIHLVSSFFTSVLAGKDSPIDRGDGAGMNLLNLKSWDWDNALLEATAPELREKLPPVASCDTVAGTLAPYFSEKYGIAADIPVVVFTGDNPSSLVGMGASRPGKVVISLGTSDTFFAAMPEAATDPDGYGHVFGNPAGGGMTLQCFVNGSLAREKVKDQYQLDWDAFTEAFEKSPIGAEGNRMLPFFMPEISPRLDIDQPLLKGSESFEAGKEPRHAVRACVEGQFLNMFLRTRWMGLETDTVYLTGGASVNPAIAQTVANIFQARVQRLAVSGSVGLGGAMRAASAGKGVSLKALEEAFCQPVAGSTVEPDPSTQAVYAEAAKDITALIDSQS